MKKEFTKPCIEFIKFDKHEDIITCSGESHVPGCGHGNHNGNNGHHNQWPTFPWWPWHW